jgi:acetylornithine deacetylase/succinyl-diaminopimelate desuccinylase-like protein
MTETRSTPSEQTIPPSTEYAAELCARLIRFDTSNRGGGDAEGERDIAEHVAALLDAAGAGPRLLERTPRRSNVVGRVPGRDPSLPAVLVQAHLDVVPADPADWAVPPFAGEIRDGYVWGRGAVDMKDTCAKVLTVLRDWAVQGRRPARDVVVAFVADEEDMGEDGAHWLVEQHAELFEGCAVAVSETGAFTHHVDGVRLYPVATAERGTAHLRLTARGRAGHASRRNDDNPVIRLVAALHRLATHRWPVHLTPAVRAFLTQTAAALGVDVDMADVDGSLAKLGAAAALAEPTVRASTTPTMLEAGYKVNVVPAQAQAQVDVRTLPGIEDDVLAVIDELLGEGITREFVGHQPPVQAPIESPWFTAMADAVRAVDREAVVVPYCMGGGTDAKAFTELGIDCYGFAPLWVPADFDYRAMAHGVDERVPVTGLGFGVQVMDHFLSR